MRLLRVVAPHFVAGAVWEFDNGWRCTSHVAPIIAWMRGKSADEVKRYLDRKHWAYEWAD